MNNKFQEMKKKRFQFLNKLFEITGGSEYEIVNMFELGSEMDFSKEDINLVGDYLAGEGLIKYETLGGGIIITHYGIKQIEEAYSHPVTETRYFPPVNIMYVNKMSGSQIQQGTIDSSQKMDLSTVELQSIARFIGEFKNKLPELQLEKDAKQEADAEISTLEAQLRSPKPKSNIIRECLATIKVILENVASQVLATALLGQLPKF